jgi:hypothetical protein
LMTPAMAGLTLKSKFQAHYCRREPNFGANFIVIYRSYFKPEPDCSPEVNRRKCTSEICMGHAVAHHVVRPHCKYLSQKDGLEGPRGDAILSGHMAYHVWLLCALLDQPRRVRWSRYVYLSHFVEYSSLKMTRRFREG